MEAGSDTDAQATPPSASPWDLFMDEIARGGTQSELTYDLDNIERLKPEERDQLRPILERRAEADGDLRAMETLAALGEKDAIPLLERLQTDPRPSVRVTATRALGLLQPSSALAARLGAELGQGLAPLDAAEAAWSLRQMNGPEAIAGLLLALRSGSLTARMHGWEGLQEKLALPSALIEPHQTPLRTLYTRSITGLDSVWPAGAVAAAEAFAAIARGESAESLGLVYLPGDRALVDRLWASLEEDSKEIDVVAISAMQGHDRIWAEYKLIYELGARDPRAAAAIGALGLAFAIPALQEARRRWAWSEPLVAAIDQSLTLLGGAAEADEATIGALQDALLSGDVRLRDRAWTGLLNKLAIDGPSGPDDLGPVAALHLRILNPLRAVWQPAAYRVRKLIRQGIIDEALSAYLPGEAALRSAALATLNAKTGDPIDLSAIRAMTGHDRDWFEASLLSRVGKRDVQAIDAAAALRLKGFENLLQEANKEWSPLSPELAVTIRAALLFLQR